MIHGLHLAEIFTLRSPHQRQPHSPQNGSGLWRQLILNGLVLVDTRFVSRVEDLAVDKPAAGDGESNPLPPPDNNPEVVAVYEI